MRSFLTWNPLAIWLIAICAIIGFGSTSSWAQPTTAWKPRTPPDRLFSVELPAPLKKVPIFEAEIGVYEPEEKSFLDTVYFVADEADRDKPRFAVIVFGAKTVREMRRISRKQGENPNEMLEMLATFHMTDDDSGTELSKPSRITINGVRGTQYTYEKTWHHGPLFTRGAFMNRGSRIYFMVYVGKDSQDLFSTSADRFFNSFKLR